MPMMQEQGHTDKALSVSAALALAKNALESFNVTLVGEVSEVSNKPGYKAVYFSVKDSSATLPCMMWLNRYNSAGVDLRVGMLVELTGRFSLYAAKGRMNFDVSRLSIAGEGNLRLRVAELAKKLAAEGLTDQARKRTLPAYPEVIGVVTSPRGAAVHDVLRTLRRRYPLAKVVLAGVPVEGENAPTGLIEALDVAYQGGAEVVLLVRGGGSFEDLMPFNDERLARKVASMPVPVVTGIGHEPDTTIADMVSDFRASTPTAAAEAVSPSRAALDEWSSTQLQALSRIILQKLEREQLRLIHKSESALFNDANALFAQEAQALDYYEERLQKAIPNAFSRDEAWIQSANARLKVVGGQILVRFNNELAIKASRLQDLSPLEILSRGYSIARDPGGRIIKSVEGVIPGDTFDLDVMDGVLACSITQVKNAERAVLDWEDVS